MISSQFKETFAALQSPNYRLWFIGQLVSLVGTWMQSTAQGFLIFQITHSPAFLGYVSFAAGIPFWIFTLYGGVIADRISKRKLLIITQSAMMILAVILAILTFTNLVQAWHVIVLSFFLGVANAFDAPARQSFVVELIDRKDMTNAIALNATMFNLGVVIGPAVAGLVYAWLGPAWCFTINAISFIAVIIALAMMKLVNHPIILLHSPIEQLKEGFTAAFSNKTIRLLLTNLLVVGTFGFGVLVLIPAWAVNVLNGDVTTNGLLLSARGLGSLLGGLMIATLGSRGFRGRIWTIGSFVLPVSMLIFGTATHVPFSLLMIAIVGWSIISVVNVSNALIQANVSDEMRGRVMSFYTLIFIGGQTLGGLLTGVLAEKINEPFAVYLSAGMLALTAILTYVLKPFLRNVA
jgi:predicted MFS family arabinose efflux permease